MSTPRQRAATLPTVVSAATPFDTPSNPVPRLDPARLTTIFERVVPLTRTNRGAALAPNTRKAQLQDRKHFWNWAAATHQLQPHYPLHPAIVLDYVLTEQRRLAPSTLRRCLATLSADHRDHGLEDPCKNAQVRRMVKGAFRSRIREGWAPTARTNSHGS